MESCGIILVAAYILPSADVHDAQRTLAGQILHVEWSFPDSLVIVLGDFNKGNLSQELPKYHVMVHLIPSYRQRLKLVKPVMRTIKCFTAEAEEELRACLETTDWEAIGAATDNLDEYTDTCVRHLFLSVCFLFCTSFVVFLIIKSSYYLQVLSGFVPCILGEQTPASPCAPHVTRCALWSGKYVLYSVLAAQASEASSSGEPGSVSGFSASGEDPPFLRRNGDDYDVDQLASEFLRDDRKKRKGKGKKKNKQKSRSTTASKAEHTFSNRGLTSTLETTEDPCTSTHLGFCIHGYCQRMEGLQEPVCICIKGYDGERCGIQTLETIKTRPEHGSGDGVEWDQMALVITALVLSIISCGAVLLMACAHYRSKSILASYLGSCSEQQKLQKPASDVVV
ncbi:uncharacterized protein areg [Nerophis lumbriciformis]|uniref:uncharacterized protein areg n=1 Tax=Nerophis lumbriciformis TaxID=546530 RepID=UPI003BA9B154